MIEPSREITLHDLAGAVVRQRRIVLACVASAFAIAVLYAIFAKPVYSASVIIQPQSSQSGGGALAALAGKLGSVSSSLTGLSLGRGASDQNNYIATLKSRELALRFIQQYNLAPLLFPGRWDAQTRSWKRQHPGTLSRLRLSISRGVAQLSHDQGWQPPGDAPTTWQTLQAFRNILVIKDAGGDDPGVLSVTFKCADPQLAMKWANEYVALANSLIRARVISQTQLALSYLTQEAQQTSVTETKDGAYQLIEQHLDELIDAKSKADFAFQIIDPAIVPGKPSSPRRALIVIGAMFVGLMAGSLFAIFREFYAGARRSEAVAEGSGSGTNYSRPVRERP